MKYNMNENKTKASQIDKHLKYNNQVSYNIYNVDQMAENTNWENRCKHFYYFVCVRQI